MTKQPETSYKVDKLRDLEDIVTWKGNMLQILLSSDPLLLDLILNRNNNTTAARSD